MSSDPLLDHIDDYTKLQSDFNSIFSCDKTYKEITDAYHRSFPSLSSLMSALNVHAQSGIDINDVNDIKQRREKFGQYKIRYGKGTEKIIKLNDLFIHKYLRTTSNKTL